MTRARLGLFQSRTAEHYLANTSYFGLRCLSKFLPSSSLLMPMTGIFNILHGLEDYSGKNLLDNFSNIFGALARAPFVFMETPPSESEIKSASQMMGASLLLKTLHDAHHLIRDGFSVHNVLNMLVELGNTVVLFREPDNYEALLSLTIVNLAMCAYSYAQDEEIESTRVAPRN